MRPDKVCTNCMMHGTPCTNNRVRQKSGPKKIHKKTMQHIKSVVEGKAPAQPRIHSNLATTTTTTTTTSGNNNSTLQQDETFTPFGIGVLSTCEKNPVALSQLQAYLEVFRMRYYGIWPVLDVDKRLQILRPGSVKVGNTEFLVLDPQNASSYALCCSLCAAIARHTEFWTEEEFDSVSHLGLRKCPHPQRYVKEAERTIYEYQLDGTPTADLVLTYFFLHVYFCSQVNKNPQELIYLRQAISCAQLLWHFDRANLDERSRKEAHTIKKIYYLLLMTERYVSFKTKIPVLLEPTLPLPNLEDDDHPEVLRGFIELAEVYSATDSLFYNDLSIRGRMPQTALSIMTSSFEALIKKDRIRDIQERLGRAVAQTGNSSQKLNTLLSRTWLQSIAWSLSHDQKLLTPASQHADCFDVRYPVHIATDFLIQASSIPIDAFETNGIGVVLKLIELTDALHSFIHIAPAMNTDTTFAFDQLSHLHNIILRHGCDIVLPKSFSRITDLLEARRFGFRHLGGLDDYASSNSGTDGDRFEEIRDDDQQDHAAVLPDALNPFIMTPGEHDHEGLTPLLKEFEFPIGS